jgi:hypothetical protein
MIKSLKWGGILSEKGLVDIVKRLGIRRYPHFKKIGN